MSKWQCKCGAKRDKINNSAEDKCTRCYTFSADHYYRDSHNSGRCDKCDTRFQSHR